MATNLLRTKLYQPPVRAGLVRPRPLLNPGPRALARKPADAALRSGGIWQTRLLAQWIGASPAARSDRVAWVSLDAQDDDPARSGPTWWQPCRACSPAPTGRWAVRSAWPGSCRSRPACPALLTDLLNEMAGLPDPACSSWTSYHTLQQQQDPRRHQFPAGPPPRPGASGHCYAHDPPLQLARLRARGQLVSLRAEDLRFTFGEAAEFVDLRTGLTLAPDDIAGLGYTHRRLGRRPTDGRTVAQRQP